MKCITPNFCTLIGAFSLYGFSSSALANDTAESDSQVLQNLDIVDSKNKQIVKTLQKKNFLKLKRWELSPHVAFVANDPFLNRYILGAGVAALVLFCRRALIKGHAHGAVALKGRKISHIG